MVQCSCGERIQVPQSALGRTGICPSCGATIQITRENATPFRPGSAPPPQQSARPPDRAWNNGAASNAPDEIRRRFAEAVDLYFAKRYSEALVIFNSLSAMMPQDADIQMGQSMCLNALRKISPMELAHEARGQLPSPIPAQERIDAIVNGPTPALDQDFFRRFLIDKMLHGGSDDVQMRAAELAAKMFGFLDGEQQQPPATGNIEELFTDSNDDMPRPTPFRRAAAPDDIER